MKGSGVRILLGPPPSSRKVAGINGKDSLIDSQADFPNIQHTYSLLYITVHPPRRCSARLFAVWPSGSAAGLALLRRGAPTRPVLSGALTGLAASAGTAAGYALHCTEDSPLFYVSWYGLALCLASALGAWLGHRHLRW
ncbi:MAG TPA: hypothetical protein DEB47_14365 [Citreicella sp.]|nr:hypothetical protein [Citreicella sp.]